MTAIKTVRYRRKRSGQTDYKARRALLTARKLRVVIRKSLRHLSAQVVEYQAAGDRVLIAASTKELIKLGWAHGLKNTSSAYLLGLLLAKKAKDKKLKGGIIDLARYTTNKGNKLFAVVKGIIDGGFGITADKVVFPSQDRIEGAHIVALAKGKHAPNQFAALQKQKGNPQDISKDFATVRDKLQ